LPVLPILHFHLHPASSCVLCKPSKHRPVLGTHSRPGDRDTKSTWEPACQVLI
jgi:hypothetical protein